MIEGRSEPHKTSPHLHGKEGDHMFITTIFLYVQRTIEPFGLIIHNSLAEKRQLETTIKKLFLSCLPN